MNKKAIIYWMFFLIISCEDDCPCREVREKIDIPINVLEDYKSVPNDYCCILRLAMKKDKESVRKISLLDFSDGFIYEHGNTLLELIHYIGEDNYIRAIKNISKKDKQKIEIYLKAGIDFSKDEKFNNKNISEIYSNLGKFLNE